MLSNEGEIFLKLFCNFPKDFAYIRMAGTLDVLAKIYNQFDVSPAFLNIFLEA
jgi:hypothetical protein